MAEDSGQDEKDPLHRRSPNPDRRLPVGGGVQPAANCEIAAHGECGMKRHPELGETLFPSPFDGHENGIGKPIPGMKS